MLSFVKKDLDILQEAHEVRSIEFKGNFAGFIGNLCQLWKGVAWCDVTFSWFGKLHAFFAVLFSRVIGKKSIVVAGGDDVGQCNGLWSQPLKRWCPWYVFAKADKILTVSSYNQNEAFLNLKIDAAKAELIYHGFDYSKFLVKKENKKDCLVLTVSQITKDQIERKGLDVFIQTAALIRGVPFVLVGPWQDNSINYLKKIATSNVIFTCWLPENELIDYVCKAKVYLQISRHEAFGCSLAEAMLCECVPVVFNGTALPEVVGDGGYYVNTYDPIEIAAKVRLALQDNISGQKAREIVIKNFPLEKRRKKLLGAVESVVNR